MKRMLSNKDKKNKRLHNHRHLNNKINKSRCSNSLQQIKPIVLILHTQIVYKSHNNNLNSSQPLDSNSSSNNNNIIKNQLLECKMLKINKTINKDSNALKVKKN